MAAGFPKDCAVCHTTTQWKGAKFDHSKTKFPLTGSHTFGAVRAVPRGRQVYGHAEELRLVPPGRVQQDDQSEPRHGGLPEGLRRLPHDGAVEGRQVRPHNGNPIPAHRRTHVRAVRLLPRERRLQGHPKNCDGCHLAAYNGTTNPNHVTAGFPKDCTICHNTTQWKGAKFDHSTMTQFPLTGAHTTVQCGSCHESGVYKGTAKTCDGCHLASYNKTTSPNHVAAAFPKDCSVCHTTTQWKGAKFDHTAMTQFPLTGAHTSVQCAQCHVNGIFKGTVKTCDGCHLAAYNGTTNPNHATAGFPKTCTTCHNTTQWKGAKFDHTAMTQFPLTGAHTSVQCAQCHVSGVFKGTVKTCDGCHLATYNKTKSPNHVAAAFPKDCSVCHTTTQWKGAKFDHTAMTQFPLTGAHAAKACTSCHSNGVYKGTPKTCDGCHLGAYTATTNPNHVTAGFPKDCSTCHNTTGWKPAAFDHAKTRFALTGAHTKVQCASCHVGGRYAGTPTDCYTCHRTVYETVQSPNHLAAGLPKDCTTCHNTTQWTGAKITHKFPIYSGSHAGKWTTCNDCHRTPTSYAVFSCIDCHQHNKTDMDRKHRDRSGYVYASPSCYQCHPKGKS